MQAAVVYNQLINGAWTLLAFAPVLAYWVQNYQPKLLFAALFLSFIPLLLPAQLLQRFLLSRKRSFYLKLGVKKAQRYTQHGSLVNRWIRKSQPAYAIITNRKDLRKYRTQMMVYEKYHLAAFVFFNLSMLLALGKQAYAMTAVLLLVNILYNVYPILIQHYNKLRTPRA